jgi:phospholipid/cholesterol/gamma-HCH transport system substrate-binding protein
MKSNYFEIIIGTFVLLCAILFLATSMKKAGIENSEKYFLLAKFENADGIKQGSDVKISGVKIGFVEDSFLDEKNYRATLKIKVDKGISLPTDSSAKIASAGLLGEKYIQIAPGSDDELLKQGDEITFTQSSVNLEDLLGKFIFDTKDEKK